MVIMLEIGQSAALLPNPVIVGNGGCSETERVLVSNERLTILKMLKIQSDPLGNFGESSGDEIYL